MIRSTSEAFRRNQPSCFQALAFLDLVLPGIGKVRQIAVIWLAPCSRSVYEKVNEINRSSGGAIEPRIKHRSPER